MANIPLQSIQFPGLEDTYTVPQIDTTLTQTGYAADAKVVGDAIASTTVAAEDANDDGNIVVDNVTDAWMDEFFTNSVVEATEDWLDEHVTGGTTLVIDDTLTVSGAAADAKVTGDEIGSLKSDLNDKIDAVNEFAYKNADSIENILNGENVDYSVPCVFRLGEVRSQSMYDTPRSDDTRMGSQVIKLVKDTVNVSLPSGYKAIVAIYDSDGTYAGYKPNAGYTEGSFEVTISSTITYPYIILAVRKTDNSAISLSTVDSSLFIVSFGTVENPIGLSKTLYENFLIDDSTFDLSLLDVDVDGYMYRQSTLPTTHQNVAWCERKNGITSVSVKVKLSSSVNNGVRLFFENANRDRFWMNFAVTTAQATSVMLYTWSVASMGGSGLSITPTLDAEHLITVNFVGDYIQLYFDKVLVYSVNMLNTAVDIRHICRVGYGFRGSGENAFYRSIKVHDMQRFASISFDDQLTVLQTLTNNASSYTSLFECPGFDYLKTMHDQYGCKFTLMLFYQWEQSDPTFTLDDVTTTFKTEFTANSDWLKFAYHGPDTTTYPSAMTTSDLVSSVESVYTAITAFAGAKCIDKVPRMSMFNCTEEQAIALRDADLMVGFLTADDTRSSNTGLSGLGLSAVQNCDYYVDYEHDIRYYRTSPRFDSLSADEIIDVLNDEWNDPSNNRAFVLFSHAFNTSAMQTDLTAIIVWLANHGIRYEFPMNIII